MIIKKHPANCFFSNPIEIFRAGFIALSFLNYIAKAMEVTKGAITNSLKKLEAKGFITVTPDENSGRQKVVRLTPEGQRARNEAIISATPAFEQLFQIKKLSARSLLQRETDALTLLLVKWQRSKVFSTRGCLPKSLRLL